jgi:CheY-like chemotaxis protein
MDKLSFHGMFRDLLLKLHDFAALETHPLAQAIELPAGGKLSRGEFLRQSIFSEIDRLKPGNPPMPPSSPEQRAYLILYHRYVEGMPIHELAAKLAISDRQLRRDHSRALQGLAGRVWERYYHPTIANRTSTARTGRKEPATTEFSSNIERLDFGEILRGVAATIQPWADAEGLELQLQIPDQTVEVQADRVVVRQILISLFSLLLHTQSGKHIRFGLMEELQQAGVYLEMESEPEGVVSDDQSGGELLSAIQYWVKLQHGVLQPYRRVAEQVELAGLQLWLPQPTNEPILVVDDQPATARIFQRFASQLPFKVIGLQDAALVVDQARRVRPCLITLDVMMPFIDGWELLQALKLDEETRHIPVVVCSAWEEPELARSLGAHSFLKKPVTRKDFIAVLNELGLLQPPPYGGENHQP